MASSQTPNFYSGFPSITGMDFSPNRQGIYGRGIKLNINPDDSTFKPTEQKSGVEGQSPIGTVYDDVQKRLDLERGIFPLQLEMMRQQAGLQAQLSQRQLFEAYPLLSQAAEEAARRSQKYRFADLAFREQLPSATSLLTTEAQKRMGLAQAGEAGLLAATADALRAGAASQGTYQGTTLRAFA